MLNCINSNGIIVSTTSDMLRVQHHLKQSDFLLEREHKMAERRMFAKAIIDSDAFLDMPLSTQALYFHLAMRADDEGFVSNPKKIQRMIGASDDDLKVLISKQFVLVFDTGIIVIRHWKIHNYIQNDRRKETLYKNELAMLNTDDNKIYQPLDTSCIQNGYILDTQDSIGKNSIGKLSIVEDSIGKNTQSVSDDTDYRTKVQRIVDAWNEIGVSPVKKLSPSSKRYKMLLARMKDYSEEDILQAINEVKMSSFLQGSGKFIIDFEWFVKPNNFPKVLEGKYRDREDAAENKPRSYMERIDNRISDVDKWGEEIKRDMEQKGGGFLW